MVNRCISLTYIFKIINVWNCVTDPHLSGLNYASPKKNVLRVKCTCDSLWIDVNPCLWRSVFKKVCYKYIVNYSKN